MQVNLSRSKHTRPAHIIAAERVRTPRGKRDEQNVAARQMVRILKEFGIELCEPANRSTTETGPTIFPRITVQRTHKGYLHPADKRDITRLLEQFGELAWYGVREICLVQNSELQSDKFKFGALSVPGKILLYEQPEPPWICSGLPNNSDLLNAAGAVITTSTDGSRSMIDWTLDDLRDFMLFDVLMHEIGHHLVQQFTGKRQAQVLRSKDHESVAANFARRCREQYVPGESK